MRHSLAVRAAGVALASMIAFAPAAVSAQKADNEKKKDDEVVCRTSYSSTSRMGGPRVCMTRAEWAEYRKASNKSLGDVSPNGTTRTTGTATGVADLTGPGSGPR